MNGFTNLKNDVHTTQEKLTDLRSPIDYKPIYEISGVYTTEFSKHTGAVFDNTITTANATPVYTICKYEKKQSGQTEWHSVEYHKPWYVPTGYDSTLAYELATIRDNGIGVAGSSSVNNDSLRNYHYIIGYTKNSD